jgi:cytochrome c-type biogenesis protein CcmE
MTHTRIKLIIAGLAIAIAVGFLAVAGARDGWVYFLPVDKFMENPTPGRVRLHGKVGTQDCVVSRASLTAEFDLLGETRSIRVQYSGVVPEMFDIDRDVVVEGTRDEVGVFRADTLLTKCASKYESGDGEAPHADPHVAKSAGAAGAGS